ncbi:MAG: hypothetical protein WCJ62_09570 [Flavobacterium sp.]
MNNSLPEFPINEKYWRGMAEQELVIFKTNLLNHFQSTGFPYSTCSPEELVLEVEKTSKYLCTNSVINNGVVKQTMHLLGELWSYFPHSYDIKCGSSKTPLEAFNTMLEKVIERRLKIGTYISNSGMRKILKTFTGVQGVSNFRPTSAYAIYDRYGGGDVWDMSMGFGGRLVGAYLCKKVKSYTGTDPSSLTFDGLLKLKNDLCFHKANLIKKGSEDYIPPKNSLDICFTSPPYFNTEKYSLEATQSYLTYPTKEDWFNGFLASTIRNCIIGLKSGGILAINIANVKSYKTLEKETVEHLNSYEQLEYVETLQYSLSAIGKNVYKYEPIFVYKKK